MDAQQQEQQQAAESQNVTRGEITLMLHQLKGELVKHQEQLSQASEIKVFCEQMVLAGKMTPAERDVIILRVFEGLSHREIARRLGRPSENAVHKLYGRALAKLAELLGRSG